jgi:hypothetical protein
MLTYIQNIIDKAEKKLGFQKTNPFFAPKIGLSHLDSTDFD